MRGAAREVESNADIALLISMSVSTSHPLAPLCPLRPLIDLNCQVEIVAMRRNTASSGYMDQFELVIQAV